jgi:autotransporter-associated beta strand protein
MIIKNVLADGWGKNKCSEKRAMVSPGWQHLRTLFLAAWALSLGDFAFAASYSWNTTTGSWSLNTNWTGSPPVGGPDASGDIITLSAASTSTISLFNTGDAGDATKTIGSLTASGGTLTLAAGTGSGILDFNNGGSNATLTQTAGNITITAPITLTSSLNVANSNGSGTTNRLFLNGVISGAGGIVINSGSGQVAIGGVANTFTGGVTLNSGGILSLTGGPGSSGTASAFGTGTFTINGGTITSGGAAGHTITTNNLQAWNGDFTIASSSFTINLGTGAVTMNANRTITMSGSLATTVGGAIGDGGNGYSLTLAGSGAGALILTGSSTYTGATTIGAGSSLSLGGTTGALSLSSAIIDNGTFSLSRTNTITQGTDFASVISGTGVVRQSGTGTSVLNGANTYTGATNITAGTLSVSSLNSVVGGTSSSNLGAPVTVANGTIGIGSTTTAGALTYTGTGETTDRVINLAGTTGGATLTQSGTGLLKFTSNLTATGAGAKTLTLAGSTAGTGEISGSIVNSSSATSISKSGTGTWTLSGANTYTGTTTITGGTLSVSSLNSVVGGTSSSNLGAPVTVANGTIGIGSTTTAGTLLYTGTGETTDRVINLAGTTGGATLNQSGTGLLKFTSNLTATGAGAKMLTLAGSTAGKGEISGNIVNSSSATSVTKSGTGTWTLSGTNTYTGATTVSGGTLLVNGSLAAGSAVSVSSGATLGGSGTVNGLVTTAGTGSILSPGNSPGTLTLAGGLNAAAGAGFTFELGTSSDLLSLGSGVFTGSTAANGLVFDFSDSGGFSAGTVYTLLTFGSSSGLDYSDLLANLTPSGYTLDSGFGTGGFLINSGSLQVQFAAVPEPSTGVLLVGGVVLLGLLRRKKRTLS